MTEPISCACIRMARGCIVPVFTLNHMLKNSRYRGLYMCMCGRSLDQLDQNQLSKVFCPAFTANPSSALSTRSRENSYPSQSIFLIPS